MLCTARKLGVRFSVTARQDRKIRAAIEAIPEGAWVPIPYWLSTPEVSGADVAETSYRCFAGSRDAIDVRLVVRRVRLTPGLQLALFTAWDYHAFVTDRPGELVEIEADHRRHAVVEQSIAELKSAGLAHLPSGRFMANAVWLALTVMGHTSAAPSASSPVPTCTARRPPRCAARCSAFPAAWCAPPVGCTCDYPPAGHGATAFLTALTHLSALPLRS